MRRDRDATMMLFSKRLIDKAFSYEELGSIG
jgi:hypothetical protein